MSDSKMITLLNTSIITEDGYYWRRATTLDQVIAMLAEEGFFVQSAIGHKSTADILTELLGIPVEVNRMQYRQQAEDVAIVFQLNERPEEGKILSREEIEEIGYSFKVLYRVN
jgi:hypothetical protein